VVVLEFESAPKIISAPSAVLLNFYRFLTKIDTFSANKWFFRPF